MRKRVSAHGLILRLERVKVATRETAPALRTEKQAVSSTEEFIRRTKPVDKISSRRSAIKIDGALWNRIGVIPYTVVSTWGRIGLKILTRHRSNGCKGRSGSHAVIRGARHSGTICRRRGAIGVRVGR